MTGLIKRAFTGLVPIAEVRAELLVLTTIDSAADFAKQIQAVRKYDGDTQERRNYWGELAVWSERRLGALLIEAKANGTIKHGGDKNQAVTLTACLGTETDVQAQHISSRSQKLAKPTDKDVAAAIEKLKESGEEGNE